VRHPFGSRSARSAPDIPVCGSRAVFRRSVRRAITLWPDLQSPFFRLDDVLVSENHSRTDNRTCKAGIDGERRENPLPDALDAPAAEMSEHAVPCLARFRGEVASRKGIEPLTPGLGNLCSILLSYRDRPPRSRRLSGAGAIRTTPQCMIRIAFSFQDPRIRKPPLYPAEQRTNASGRLARAGRGDKEAARDRPRRSRSGPGQTRPDQTRSDQIRSDQIRSDQRHRADSASDPTASDRQL
jgi:hypothetical protein